MLPNGRRLLEAHQLFQKPWECQKWEQRRPDGNMCGAKELSGQGYQSSALPPGSPGVTGQASLPYFVNTAPWVWDGRGRRKTHRGCRAPSQAGPAISQDTCSHSWFMMFPSPENFFFFFLHVVLCNADYKVSETRPSLRRGLAVVRLIRRQWKESRSLQNQRFLPEKKMKIT